MDPIPAWVWNIPSRSDGELLNGEGCGDALRAPQAITPFFGLAVIADTEHHALRVVVPENSPALLRQCGGERTNPDDPQIRRLCGIVERDARTGLEPR